MGLGEDWGDKEMESELTGHADDARTGEQQPVEQVYEQATELPCRCRVGGFTDPAQKWLRLCTDNYVLFMLAAVPGLLNVSDSVDDCAGGRHTSSLAVEGGGR